MPVSKEQKTSDREAIFAGMTSVLGRLAEVSGGTIATFEDLKAQIAKSPGVKNPDLAARWSLFNAAASEQNTDIRFIRYTCGRYNDSQIEKLFLLKWDPTK